MFKCFFMCLIAILSYSCGTDIIDGRVNKSKKIEEVVPEQAIKIVKDFIYNCQESDFADICNKNLKNLTLFKFTDSDIDSQPMVVGACFIYGSSLKHPNGKREIVIKDVYDRDTYSFRALIWHELGHCLANMNHMNSNLHIMMPNMLDEDLYMANWLYFKERFFDTYQPDAPLSLQSHGDTCNFHLDLGFKR